MGKFLSFIKRNTSGPFGKDLDNLDKETPEDRAPRRPRCCARAGGGTCPTRREASAECPSLRIQFTHKKSNILDKVFISPASSAALITGLFQSKSSQMARPRRPRGVSTTTTCNVKMTTVNTTTSNDGEEYRPPVVWGRCRRLVTRMSKGCTCAKLCEVMTRAG